MNNCFYRKLLLLQSLIFVPVFNSARFIKSKEQPLTALLASESIMMCLALLFAL